MTSYQIKKLNMFIALQNLIATTSPQIIALMPQFEDFYNNFKNHVNTLLQQSVIQNQSIKGYTELKLAQKENMINQAIEIAININAYAEVTNNIKLKEDVNYNKSYLYKIQEINCIDTCKNIYKTAKDNIQELDHYKINIETLDRFNTAISDFNNSYTIPKEHITIKKMATIDIKKHFTDATQQTTKMDALVNMIKPTQTEFANLYFLTRKIEKPAHTTLALKANISDPNNNPIAKVQITSEQIKFSKPKFTTKLGNFQLKNLPSDVYTITLTKPGYITQTLQIALTSGERTQLKITLTPTPSTIN